MQSVHLQQDGKSRLVSEGRVGYNLTGWCVFNRMGKGERQQQKHAACGRGGLHCLLDCWQLGR